MRLPRGLLIAIEGIDGAGKTTQARLLRENLERAGLEVVSSKEPTDGPHGRRIRRSAHEGRMSPQEELAAFLADRKEHVEKLIGPSLADGKVIIIDRYYFSTAAYQGIRGLDPEELLTRNEEFAPQPDLLVILDVPAKVGVARIRARGDADGNLFERLDDLDRAGALFRRMARPYLALLDGTQGVDELAMEIQERIQQLIDVQMCPKAPERCEPAHCSLRLANACPSPALPLTALGREHLRTVEQIVADKGLSDDEKIERIRGQIGGS